jgi:hypothetical protein
MKTRLFILALAANLLAGLGIAGCGSTGGSSTNTTPTTANTIALSCPNGPCSVQTSEELAWQTLQLAATCNGSTPCTTTAVWEVTSGGGTVVNNEGLYTAPTAIPSGGSAVITAFANGVSGSINITITQGPTPVIVAYSNTTTQIEMVGAFNLNPELPTFGDGIAGPADNGLPELLYRRQYWHARVSNLYHVDSTPRSASGTNHRPPVDGHTLHIGGHRLQPKRIRIRDR